VNLFINERTLNRYAETIAIEDIYEEYDTFLPEEGDYVQETEF
jgi:hypothetical protein